MYVSTLWMQWSTRSEGSLAWCIIRSARPRIALNQGVMPNITQRRNGNGVNVPLTDVKHGRSSTTRLRRKDCDVKNIKTTIWLML